MTPTYTVTADTRQLIFLATVAVMVVAISLAYIAVSFLLDRRKHPDQASTPGPGTSPVPGQSPTPVDGQPVPRLAGHAPAPGLYGRCVMVTWSFDTGISVVHDRYRAQWHVDLPDLEDDEITALLDREAP